MQKSIKPLMVLLCLVIALFCSIYYDLLLTKKIFVHDSLEWFGVFNYFFDNLKKGIIPLWDPYMMTGTFFYPNISIGYLDPTLLVAALIAKLFSVSSVTIFIYMRLFRLALLIGGTFLLFRYLTRCSRSSLLAATVLLFAITPQYFVQNGMVDQSFTSPYAMFFLLKGLDTLGNKRKYLYFSLLALTAGIAMNIFIPTLFLFNLVFFALLVLIVRRRELLTAGKAYLGKGFIGFCLLLSLLVAMMAAPPVVVMLKDASAKGELFPVLRLVHNNNLQFKKMMASDIGGEVFSEKISRTGVFFSYGNLVHALYPDVYKSFGYWQGKGYLSEAGFYIGLIPLIFCLACYGGCRNYYKLIPPVMIGLYFVNGFGFSGFFHHPYNSVQNFFNFIFPPLKFIDTRQNLGPFILFYLCMMLSFVLAGKMNWSDLATFLQARTRQLIIFAIGIITIKVGITYFFGNSFIWISRYDAWMILLPIILIILLYAYAKQLLSARFVAISCLFMALAELYAYNYDTSRNYKMNTITDSGFLYQALEKRGRQENEFQYFRNAFAAGAPLPAFGETIMHEKGVLLCNPLGTFFTSKRYYDLLSHIPLQNQLALSGYVFPILRFYPADLVVSVEDKHILLEALAATSVQELSNYLYLERVGGNGKRLIGTSMEEFYKDGELSWLQHPYVDVLLYDFLQQNKVGISNIRMSLDKLLRTSEYSIAVQEFTPNSLTLSVANAVPGYLFYNDGWSKYWRAFDNGKEIPVERANYNSKAVLLDVGMHTIQFVFDPRHYKIALLLYMTGFLSLSALVGIRYWRVRGLPDYTDDASQK